MNCQNTQLNKYNRSVSLMHIQQFHSFNYFIYSFTVVFENILFSPLFIFTALTYATLLFLRNNTTCSFPEDQDNWMMKSSIISYNILSLLLCHSSFSCITFLICHLAIPTNTLMFDHSFYFLRYFLSIPLLFWLSGSKVFTQISSNYTGKNTTSLVQPNKCCLFLSQSKFRSYMDFKLYVIS